jgi:transposase/DNA-binding XRE family transcriptional regulator
MRGDDQQQNQIFSYLLPEARVRKDHPLRAIRDVMDEVLRQLSKRFDAMYATAGRPSIAPEKLLRAKLLQMLYSIRSERLLMEEMDYNLLFRWFVGLNADDGVWDPTVFTKNRDRLLEAEVAKEFLARVVEQARGKGLTSNEHFSVDVKMLEAWAGLKNFQAKDKDKTPPDDPNNPSVNFRGEVQTVFGNHIRQLREQAGLTLEQLSEKSGFSIHRVRAIERGKINLNLGTMLILTMCLDTPLQDLLVGIAPKLDHRKFYAARVIPFSHPRCLAVQKAGGARIAELRREQRVSQNLAE